VKFAFIVGKDEKVGILKNQQTEISPMEIEETAKVIGNDFFKLEDIKFYRKAVLIQERYPMNPW
jgi:hypothetical protein